MRSIIIPILNRHEMTYECIQTLRENTDDYELILVDNGSDPPVKAPFTGFVDVRIIRNEENAGFPVAVNQGIKAAKGDIIILLNNDVVVPPGWADTLTAWLNEYDIVGPLTNYAAGVQGVTIAPYNSIDEYFKEAGYLSEEHKDLSQPVTFVIGFCMAFRKCLVDDIGLFDESLWPCSGEEIDFCLRAVGKGKTVGVAYDCYIHHFGSQTFQDMERDGQINYTEIVNRNDKHLADRWGEGFWQRQVHESADMRERAGG